MIKIQIMTIFIVLNFNFQAKSLRDNFFPPASSLEKIYLTEEGKFHTLIFEFTGIESDDEIKYKIHKKKNVIKFNTTLNILKNPFKIDILNYKKNKNADLKLNIQGKNDIK